MKKFALLALLISPLATAHEPGVIYYSDDGPVYGPRWSQSEPPPPKEEWIRTLRANGISDEPPYFPKWKSLQGYEPERSSP